MAALLAMEAARAASAAVTWVHVSRITRPLDVLCAASTRDLKELLPKDRRCASLRQDGRVGRTEGHKWEVGVKRVMWAPRARGVQERWWGRREGGLGMENVQM